MRSWLGFGGGSAQASPKTPPAEARAAEQLEAANAALHSLRLDTRGGPEAFVKLNAAQRAINALNALVNSLSGDTAVVWRRCGGAAVPCCPRAPEPASLERCRLVCHSV